MKIELTDKVSGKKFAINPDDVRLIEAVEGGGSHLAFDDKMGRVVVEEYDDLKAYFEIIPVSDSGLKAFARARK